MTDHPAPPDASKPPPTPSPPPSDRTPLDPVTLRPLPVRAGVDYHVQTQFAAVDRVARGHGTLYLGRVREAADATPAAPAVPKPEPNPERSLVVSHALLNRLDACGEASYFHELFGDAEVTLTRQLVHVLARVFDVDWVFTDLVRHDDSTAELRHRYDVLTDAHLLHAEGDQLMSYARVRALEYEHRVTAGRLIWEALELVGVHTLDCRCEYRCYHYYDD